MRIGILTFWWTSNNYGQILQCYALQKYLNKMGHEAFLIRYNSEEEINRNYLKYKFRKLLNPRNVVSFIKRKVSGVLISRSSSNEDRGFDAFRSKYISQSEKHYHSFSELESDPPLADIYIVGSDQVWNPYCIGVERGNTTASDNVINAYFLNFGNARRMSYAASFSNSTLPEPYQKKIIPLLEKFEYISVREMQGVKICSECGRKDAEWVCDPTMLLDAEDYRSLYKSDDSVRIREKKYMLVYILGNGFNFNLDKVFNFAEEKNLDVVYITANGLWDKREQFCATVTEWLYLIDNAEYVVTNSFHCGVFSSIFNTSFGIIPLSGRFKSMNERFDGLFERCGIDPRYVSEDDFSVLEKQYEAHVDRGSHFLDHIC